MRVSQMLFTFFFNYTLLNILLTWMH